jgi:hypothetical protein
MSILNCYVVFNYGVADQMVRIRVLYGNKMHDSSKANGPNSGVWQVLASLLVSVLLVGFRLNAAKEILQTIERRKELKTNLALLQRRLEEEDLVTWLSDAFHDAKKREDRIKEMESVCGLSCSTVENEMLQKAAAMFEVFDSSSAGVKLLEHSETVLRSETKLDAATGLLLGRAVAIVRAAPQEIIMYLLNYDSRCIQADFDPAIWVRSEVLQHVNAHHTTFFVRGKLGAGLLERTFLNSTVAARVSDDPPTFVLASLPIARHDRISPKDEKGAVRAENCRAFRLTEVAPGVTNVDYACSLNLKGFIPQAITNKIAVPGQASCTPP